MTEELVEAEVVEQELEPAPQVAANLFGTTDPALVVQRAQATADALKPIIEARQMVQQIGTSQHPKIEGLQTLGAMLGVTAVGVWTRKLDNGWEAKVDAQTLDGRKIGSAEAMCLRDEANWKDSEEYAIRSMAQTRAASKALASVLRFVLVLAGYSGTPAEEMDGVKRSGGGSTGFPENGKMRRYFKSLLEEAGGSPQTVDAIEAYASTLPRSQISAAIDRLKEKGEKAKQTGMELGLAANSWQQKQTDVPADTEGLTDTDADSYHERQEERRQREADREDFRKHE